MWNVYKQFLKEKKSELELTAFINEDIHQTGYFH